MDLDLIARTSAVLLCASALAALLRHAAPATRHFVWHLSIVIVLLAPFAVPLLPRIPIVPGVPRAEFERAPVLTSLAVEPGTPTNPAVGTLGTIGALGTTAVGGWFLLCWLLSGVSVWRGSTAPPAQWREEMRAIARRTCVRNDVEIRQMLRDGSPHVAGFFRSVVMMPPAAAEWTAESRQAALVHELMHIRRADRRTQVLAQLACAVYWFNPLVWYAAAALARERERACDDEVLRMGARPSAYAALLLELARPRAAWTPAATLSMARPSAIEGRLLMILNYAAGTPRRSTRWLIAACIGIVATTILGAQPATPQTASATEAQAGEPPAVKPKLANLMDVEQVVGVPAITKALVEALDDRDGQVREQAALGLALTPGSDVVEPLIAALKDHDAQVREKAAIGLSFRRDPRIIVPLLTAIEDADAQVREKAAIALGASGDERAIAPLRRAMTDPDSQVREKAVAGLALLGMRR